MRIQEEYGQLNVVALDPTVSDQERLAAGVPTLVDALAQANAENLRRAVETASRKELPQGVPIQRVWRDPSASALERRFHLEKSHLWVEDDELTLVWRSSAPAVYVIGGFEMPLWRIADTNLWTVTVRIANLRRAALAL